MDKRILRQFCSHCLKSIFHACLLMVGANLNMGKGGKERYSEKNLPSLPSLIPPPNVSEEEEKEEEELEKKIEDLEMLLSLHYCATLCDGLDRWRRNEIRLWGGGREGRKEKKNSFHCPCQWCGREAKVFVALCVCPPPLLHTI